ncbi:neprilysin-2-like [Bradysia coprophila]|uniref:neprilysin-2-like n=1 Tax=Bradysia coprophila TaxID=38358 RepID=UPI00187D79D0|nr:neprilysin-2-like [Bradysia coprophila]
MRTLATILVVLNSLLSTHTLSIHGEHKHADSTARIVEEVPTASQSVCNTTRCIDDAAALKSKLNENVDPCDNFYEFACGNFVKNTEPDNGWLDPFAILSRRVQLYLYEILRGETQPDELKAISLAKNFFSSCLNTTAIEKRGLKPLTDILHELGGWPILEGDSWSEVDFNWVELLKQLKGMGLNTNMVFGLTVDRDLKNSSKNVLYIDQTDFDLERPYLINGFSDEDVRDFHKTMIDTAVALKASPERAAEEMKSALEFEIELAKISFSSAELRNVSAYYHPYAIKDLQELYPYLDWLDFINAFMPTDQKVNENEIVINSVPKFFEQLGKLLNSTSGRTIANYMLWRTVYSVAEALTYDFRTIQWDSSTEVTWRICVKKTSTEFPVPVSILYGRKYFDKELQETSLNFVNEIQNELIDTMERTPWLDEKTRQSAVKKAKMIQTYIDIPNETADKAKLDEYYENLDIDPNDMFTNLLRLQKFATDRNFGNLREPVEKLNWDSITILNLASVDAFNRYGENAIQFPLTLFKSHFSLERPQYLNYGHMGSLIAHEMFHSFDDEGRQYDFDGNLVDWWNSTTESNFLDRVQCIIDQYGNYTDRQTNLTLNGEVMQGENIADNGGTKLSYKAYQNWIKRNGPENLLPELKYNQQQLFWISYAQSWCAVYEDYSLKSWILTDSHAPGETRVNGVVSNMPPDTFANDFKCSVDTPMNPEMKCTVW